MSFHVYILYSKQLDEYYIGQTENLERRLFQHINSSSKSTKKVKDWVIVYKESYLNRSESVKRELEIKKKKSRRYIEWLISSAG